MLDIHDGMHSTLTLPFGTVAVFDRFLIDGHTRPLSDKVSQIKRKV